MPYSDKEKRKEYHKEYMKAYRKNNPDKIRAIHKKSEARPERKEYLRNWWKNSPKAKEITKKFRKSDKQKEYDREWNKANPEKVRAKHKRYYLTTKGIINRLKKIDRSRFRIENTNLTIELIERVNLRDTRCVYCGKKFNDLKDYKFIQYDHINPFKPFSENNMVRCCSSCNQSKSNSNVMEWCNFMKYSPLPIVLELLEKQNEKI